MATLLIPENSTEVENVLKARPPAAWPGFAVEGAHNATLEFSLIASPKPRNDLAEIVSR